jgi:hypothetical protein
MPRMKISGRTSGKLVFAYDIREGHIDYQRLLPALRSLYRARGVDREPSREELEEVIADLLYRTNEKVFENLARLFEKREFAHSDIQALLDQSLDSVLSGGREA